MRQLPRLTCFSVCAAFAFAAACGGSQKTGEAVGDNGSAAAPAGTEAQTFEYEAVPVTGALLAPGVTPPMPDMPRPKNIKRAKRAAERAASRGNGKDVYGYVAAVWEQAQEAAKAKNADEATKLRKSAVALLEKLHKKEGKKVNATTVRMLAIGQLTLGDEAAAKKTVESALAGAKDDAELATLAAYVYLRNQDVAAAAKTLGAVTVGDDTPPLRAYVAGWVAFDQGDFKTAQTGLVRAIKGWNSAVALPELLAALGYGAAPVADADKILSEFAGNSEGSMDRRYAWMFRLSQQYKVAGQYGLASDTLDYMLSTIAGGDAPKIDVVKFRFYQADYQFRLGNPKKAADFAIEAQKTAAACKKCVAETKEAVVKRVAELAKVFHNVYATSLDDNYYEPAHKLYAYYVNDVPARDDTETISGYLKNLEQTKTNATPANGKHDKDVMRNRVLARIEAVSACYSTALSGQPDLDGTVKLMIDVDSTGEVAGATSEPPAGQDGLARVAGCLDEAARSWTFPARSVPGKTSLTVPFTLSMAAPAEAAAPAK
ncbi:MAG TPA: AgmX/PglI C-terminal domain-containing protein [Kofleriaceae bacterium]|nr:AgmX/PglI C-terminal domain-containing protein [Kofleriaceae bacterium]